MTKIAKPVQPLARPGQAQKQLTPEELRERLIQVAAQKRTEIAQACLVAAIQGAGDDIAGASPATLVDAAFGIADAFVRKAYNVTFEKGGDKDAAGE